MRRGLLLTIGGLLALAVLAPGSAAAQDQQELEIQATPPEKPLPTPRIVPPPGAREITRPRESDFYPDNIRVRLDPAFIEPFVAIKPTGPKSAVQVGLAGWTAPNIPVSQGAGTFREVPGWFALGFALVWDVDLEGKPAPAGSPR